MQCGKKIYIMRLTEKWSSTPKESKHPEYYIKFAHEIVWGKTFKKWINIKLNSEINSWHSGFRVILRILTLTIEHVQNIMSNLLL